MNDDERETQARQIHAERHRLGYGHSCDDCRELAAGRTRRRRWGLLATLVLLAVTMLVATLVQPPQRAEAAVPQAVTIAGLDLHDGQVVKDGDRYVMVGTMYGCGFSWGSSWTDWCGFGVSTAPSLQGPWSSPSLLFDPNMPAPGTGMTFRQLCSAASGAGCFNPRILSRTGWGPNDGAWILWFNSPAQFAMWGANAYWALGGNSATGPFGASAGPPFGSTGKPSLWSCHDNGDFSIVLDNPRPPMMLCTMADQTLGSERLSYWGASGQQGTGRHNLAGAVKAEAPGAYRDPDSGTWIMTFNELNCGYCSGSPTSYATASSVDGTWTSPPNVNTAWGATPLGRRGLSATSCGGQARTVVELDGQAYQWVDLWLGARNETDAKIHLEPLNYRGPTPLGELWQPFTPWSCGT